jgi:signal recognition particle subunit SRP54
LLKESGDNPLLVACDSSRPAAIDQWKMMADSISIACKTELDSKGACKIAKHALQYAEDNHFDKIIFHTAGRLHIDKQLIEEINDRLTIVFLNKMFLVSDTASG